MPGVLLVWPLVLWRWYRLETDSDRWMTRYRPPRAVHLPVAIILAVALGVAVVLAEGAAVATLNSADVVCVGIVPALELLLNPLRLTATLRS